MTETLETRFASEMGRLLGPDFPSEIGLAVSGGGDSMAMLALAHGWARVFGIRLWVVTIDHGLRADSASEAEMVARECALLGHSHAILRWHWSGQGNVMDAARRARLRLIDGWRGRLVHVAMAHTRDDLAETFLMRLARGAGVDGLAAMKSARRIVPEAGGTAEPRQAGWPPEVPAPGSAFTLIRPCLGMGREELRHYNRTLKVPWVDDPTNADPDYERARIRAALPAVAEAGIDVAALADAANRLGRAREALKRRASEAAERISSAPTSQGVPTGELHFDRDSFAALDRETQARLLVGALRWVAGGDYKPRAAPLEALLDRLLSGGGGTLAGCEAGCDRSALWVAREPAAVKGLSAAAGALWDGRWRLSGSAAEGLEVRALGEEGWQQVPEKPADVPPHRRARALPALWDGDRLVASVHLGVGPGHDVEILPRRGANRFADFLLSD
ncbi:tRNA(Ile)-lysidine synthetase [Roseivivax halodurans JCM 10272]|uniref:tRNA(Ile)-lysidine synthase n=1 Tax=Roseivivax halodurans JCM 10272 TaxID=1449350 RepID=X7EGC7_9RHOB|nr:tRNA lysidine(34) synthetase TilS [Roseivivax halodurans]ETX15159.1 tRNA(Ile)-lysidine synthetase [Roseivivax halodurans JCM 10272]